MSSLRRGGMTPLIDYPRRVAEAVEVLQARGVYPSSREIVGVMGEGCEATIRKVRNELVADGKITITAKKRNSLIASCPRHIGPRPHDLEDRIARHAERVAREEAEINRRRFLERGDS